MSCFVLRKKSISTHIGMASLWKNKEQRNEHLSHCLCCVHHLQFNIYSANYTTLALITSISDILAKASDRLCSAKRQQRSKCQGVIQRSSLYPGTNVCVVKTLNRIRCKSNLKALKWMGLLVIAVNLFQVGVGLTVNLALHNITLLNWT